jgi:hypothetical protein
MKTRHKNFNEFEPKNVILATIIICSLLFINSCREENPIPYYLYAESSGDTLVIFPTHEIIIFGKHKTQYFETKIQEAYVKAGYSKRFYTQFFESGNQHWINEGFIGFIGNKGDKDSDKNGVTFISLSVFDSENEDNILSFGRFESISTTYYRVRETEIIKERARNILFERREKCEIYDREE